jgi:hypothetical protein
MPDPSKPIGADLNLFNDMADFQFAQAEIAR